METKTIQPKKVMYGSMKTTMNKIKDESEPVINALMADVEKHGVTPVGPLEFIYFGATGDMDKEFTLEIALPVAPDSSAQGSSFGIKDTNTLKCISHEHNGSMEDIYQVYEDLFKHIDGDTMKSTDEVREVYTKWVDFSSDENIVEIQIGVN